MSRITDIFQKLAKQGQTAFMPFFVAGDPNFKESLEAAKIIAGHADLLEIGFPYTDPLADGPVIQASHSRALGSGMNTDKVFDFIKKLRQKNFIPITAMVYANLVFSYGIGKFYAKAKKCGIDAVLIPDLPVEECFPFVRAANKYNIDPIFLISQTTSNTRLKKIEKNAKGFLYLVTVLGVTGARKTFGAETMRFLKRIRKQTSMPLAAGFGISSRRQMEQIKNTGVNGVIVGSALINALNKSSRDLKIFLEQMNK